MATQNALNQRRAGARQADDKDRLMAVASCARRFDKFTVVAINQRIDQVFAVAVVIGGTRSREK